MGRSPSSWNEGPENSSTTSFRSRLSVNSGPWATGAKMSFLKRYLVVLFLQIGCLALDHSTREITYDEDEIRLIMGHQFPGDPVKLVDDDNEGRGSIAAESQQSLGDAIVSFHPKFFNFKESPVGMPRLGVVRVDNRLKDENLKLISISGNTVHFHSSFFADKIISPGGNTTFEVVFLSRMEGPVESNLYIHTSKGLFKYHVRGFGLPNPYRLRPLVGARIPVNGSYEPLITMHNPHDKRIQVVEMLSSGTDFHLTLPDGVPEEVEGAAWAIEPFQTKSVMKGSFHGKTEGNHTGYIKIKINSTTVSSEYLLVPVEVQVSSSPGIYAPQDSLDFGLLVKSDKAKTLSLSLINAQHTPVNVQSVSVKGDANAAVRIEFRPLVLEPDSTVSTVIALVTLDPSMVTSSKQTHGIIEIKSDCGLSIGVPFRVTVLPGELQYNTSSLGFFVKSDNIPPRNFSVRNNFSAAIAIYQVSVSHPDVVRIDRFNQSQVIPPGEQKELFTMKVQKRRELCDSNSDIHLTLKSNITNLRLPITCYDGKLRLHTLDENRVDFGRIELYSTHTEYFSLDNVNPVEVRLKSWGSNGTWSHVELVGMQKGSKEDLSRVKDFDSLRKSLFLQPGHMAAFSIEVRRPTSEGSFWGEATVTTDHNQTIRVPFRYSVSKGSIYSDMIVFEKAFPGKVSVEKLHVESTFNSTLGLRGLRATPPSSMWFTFPQESPEILPRRKNYAAKVHFDPRKFCGANCYTGFTVDSPMGKMWMRGLNSNSEAGDADVSVFSTLQARYELVRKAAVMNMSVWLETDELSGYKMKTQVSYIWPRLTSSKMVVFPLTALTNETVVDIPVTNPSNAPLVVQTLLASQYGALWSHFVSGNHIGGNQTEGNLVFSLSGVIPSSSHSNGSVIFSQVQKQLVQDLFGLNDSLGITFFLPPGAKFLLKAKFRPISKDVASTVILLRNNLTGIEPIWMKGRAGTGQLTVGNGVPGSSLLLQITEKLLQGCQGEQTSKYVPPQLTVRRSFIARNIGEIPLEIKLLEVYPPQGSFWASAIASFASPVDACEGYGFRILNCHPFTLLPNQTHSIDIAFTPDFTVARVVRSLRLTDSVGGQFNYSLVAMVPSGMLSICAAIITRPSWEPVLKYLLAVGILIGIIAAALIAYFEAGSVVSSAVVATVRVIPADSRPDGTKMDAKEVTTKLDLKAVYDKVDNRFKRNQSQSPTGNSTFTKLQSSGSNITNSGSSKQSDSKDSSANNSCTTVRNRRKKGQTGSDGNLSSTLLDSSLSKPLKALSQNSVTSPRGQLVSSDDPFSNHGSSNSNPSSGNLNAGTKKSSESSKKKKNGMTSTQSNSQQKEGKCSSLMSFASLGLGKMSNGCSSKTEEETSSTTTESSNPDDVMMAVMMVRCDEEMREKERTLSGKSASSGSSSDSYNCLKTKNNIISKDTRKGPGKENGLGSYMTDFEDFTRKKAGKKKGFGTSGRRGSVSPSHDASLWDTPHSASGDGLSELAAQTQAFVMNRPSKRSIDRQQQPSLNGCTSKSPIIVGGGSHFGAGAPEGLLSTGGGLRGQRKPGVIGQHRGISQVQQPGAVHASATSSASSMGAAITAALTMAMTTPSTSSGSGSGSRQHTPPVRPSSNSGWGSEILPDNGCDIWNRKSSMDGFPTATSSSYLRSSGSSPRQDSPAFSITSSYFPSQNGYNTAPSSLQSNHNLPSQNQNLHSSSQHGYNSRHSPKGPGAVHDSYFYSSSGSGMSSELLGNLWHMNPSFDSSAIGSRVSGSASVFSPPVHASAGGQHHSSAGQHSFLHRMRSDPAARLRGSSYTTGNWSNSPYFNMDGTPAPLASGSVEMGKEGVEQLWPSVTSPSCIADSTYPDWKASSHSSSTPSSSAIPPSVTTNSTIDTSTQEIWDSGPGGSSKWPTSYGSTGLQPGINDTVTVGSSRTAANTTGLEASDYRSRLADVAQNQREIEAGLGFNPFTSDIWNVHQPESQAWSKSFRYPSGSE